MNKWIPRIVIIVVGLVVAWFVLSFLVSAFYLDRRDALVTSIRDGREAISTLRSKQRDLIDVRNDIQAFVDRTLGSNQETVEHNMRVRLNRICEAVGLHDPVVSTGRTTPRESPARRELSRARNAFHEEVDLVELEGTVRGMGTLEQGLRVLHRVQKEPWLKRIDSVSLDPRENGAQVDVTIRLTTLYIPGRSPGAEHDPSRYDGETFAQFVSLSRSNPFRIPPEAAVKPTPVVQGENPAATPTPPFPYGEWIVRFVASGTSGPEVWVENVKSKESRRLVVGDSLNELEFVALAGDQVEFRTGDGRYLVGVGQTLDERHPIE